MASILSESHQDDYRRLVSAKRYDKACHNPRRHTCMTSCRKPCKDYPFRFRSWKDGFFVRPLRLERHTRVLAVHNKSYRIIVLRMSKHQDGGVSYCLEATSKHSIGINHAELFCSEHRWRSAVGVLNRDEPMRQGTTKSAQEE